MHYTLKSKIFFVFSEKWTCSCHRVSCRLCTCLCDNGGAPRGVLVCKTQIGIIPLSVNTSGQKFIFSLGIHLFTIDS